MAAGSDYLVVGRPITRAQDPSAVVAALHEEVLAALR
jgi:orotidine-5'-phosphate decarboxylase